MRTRKDTTVTVRLPIESVSLSLSVCLFMRPAAITFKPIVETKTLSSALHRENNQTLIDKPTSIAYLARGDRGETMRSLLALQIPEHVAGGAGGFHMAHHHVPIDGAGSAVGNEYMESDADLLDKKRDKQLRQAPSMWARPKMVGIITNDKHKSSLKKPIPKGGGLGTDFSIAV